MITKRYETLLLIRTESTKDELLMIENQFDSICTESQGKLSTFDKWGKYQLAYPVDKSSYGIYILVRYELPNKGVIEIHKKINDFLKIKCNNIVLRSVTVSMNKQIDSAYEKPDPIDVGSLQRNELGSSIKEEKKIKQLLSSVDSSTSSTASVPEISISPSKENTVEKHSSVNPDNDDDSEQSS
jgi:ribosomal protein S6